MSPPRSNAEVPPPGAAGAHPHAVVLAAGAVAVALVCLPGLRDEWIAALPSFLRDALPACLVWGAADAVELPKHIVSWMFAPLAWGLWAWSGGRLIGPWPPWRRRLLVLALFFLAWTLMSLVLSRAPSLGWEEVAVLVAVASTGLLAGASLPRDRVSWILDAAAVSAGLVAGYALAQHLGLDPLTWVPASLVRERSIGTLGNPDFLAAWLVGLLPWSVVAAIRRRGFRRCLWCVGSGAIGAAVIFSFTRAAWLALLLEIVVAGSVLLPRWRRGEGERPPMGVVVGVLVSGLVFSAAVSWALRDADAVGLVKTAGQIVSPRDESSRVRLFLWTEALLIGREHPVRGTGPGTFTSSAAPYRFVESPELRARVGRPGDPHNTYLSILAASGVPAVLAWMGILGLAVRRALRVHGSGKAPWEGMAVGVGLAGLGCAHVFVRMLVPSVLLAWMLVGWSLAAREEATDPAPRTGRAWGGGRWSGGLAVVLAVAVGLLAAPVLRADSALAMSADLSRGGLAVGGAEGGRQLTQALGLLAWAEERTWEPRKGEILLTHGKLLEQIATRLFGAGDMQGGAAAAHDGVRCYQQAMLSNPLDAWRRQDLGRLLFASGMALRGNGAVQAGEDLVRQGLAASEDAVSLDPYNAVLWADLARECVTAARMGRAEEAFRRSLALSPQLGPVRVELARMLASQGRRREAIEQVSTVLEREPASHEALLLLERWRREDQGAVQ